MLALILLIQNVSFPTDRTVVWEGASRAIAFHATAKEDWAPDAAVSDPAVVEILRGPQVLAGEKIGYLRVRGLKVGKAVLTVGGAKITLEVKPLMRRSTPRIVAPVSGAAVWGKFHVGVEGDADVKLRLPDGTELAPIGDFSRRLTFEVDADRLEEGPAELRAGDSDPVVVTVVRPEDGALLAGECEASFSGRLGRAESASGGAYVANFSMDPVWSAPVDVAEAGWHQMMIVARGDLGGGAFPSVSLHVGGREESTTTGRLFDRAWRRTPVGFPVFLPAGKTTVALRFMNDYWVSARSDRNLYLDRFELLRLESDSAGHVGTEGMMRMPADRTQNLENRKLMDFPETIRPSPGLSIAFAEPMDGRLVGGALEVRGFCWWDDIGHASAPTVHLLVNGKSIGVQCGVHVRFVVDRGLLREGDNTLRLVAAHPDGRTAATPEQTVRARGKAGTPRGFHRFTAMDPRWDEGILDRLQEGDDPEQRLPRFDGGGRVTLNVPEELAGEYELFIEGEEIDGTAVLAGVERRIGGEPVVFTLKAGSKPMTFEFSRGLLRSVTLRETRSAPDRTPPETKILYPKTGHAACGADVVVVEAWDDDEIAWVDLLVDGRSMQLRARDAGRLVLPLVLRDLEPGEHVLSVRAADPAENIADSAEVRFTVRESESPGPYERALRLLDRFAYGPDPDALAGILTEGEMPWLRSQLDGDASLGLAEANLRGWENAPWLVVNGVALHLARTDNPVRARFLMWVENHFSTWIEKVGLAGDEWREHAEFARLGLAPFQELLTASATSPAMLHYLDQGHSYAGNLNENYAREIMELHTLGVDGGYTQRDVTNLAHLLCGWNVSEEASRRGRGEHAREFRFVPEIGDGRPRDIVGMRFERATRAEREDRVRLAIELLAAHPSTATFVCRKLAEHYVSMPAPEKLVEALAKLFMETGGDLKAVLLAIAGYPSPARLASPLDYGVRLLRVAHAYDGEWALQEFLARSGMGIFGSPTPDGYPEEDSAWANANGMLQRWNFARDVRWWFADKAVLPESADDEDLQHVVDVLAVKIVGRPLGEASNRAAVDYLRGAEGDPWERVMHAGVFIACLPEANLR